MTMLFFLSPILSQALLSREANKKCSQKNLEKPMMLDAFFAVYSEKKAPHDKSLEQKQQSESIQNALKPANAKLFEHLGVQIEMTLKFLDDDESKNVNGETPCSGPLDWWRKEMFKLGFNKEKFVMPVLIAQCITGAFKQQTVMDSPRASVIPLADIETDGENALLKSFFMGDLDMVPTRFLDNTGSYVDFNNKKDEMCNMLSVKVNDAAFQKKQERETEKGDEEDEEDDIAIKEEGNGRCDAHSCFWRCSSEAETCEGKSGCTWKSSWFANWFAFVLPFFTGSGTCKANQ